MAATLPDLLIFLGDSFHDGAAEDRLDPGRRPTASRRWPTGGG